MSIICLTIGLKKKSEGEEKEASLVVEIAAIERETGQAR